MIRKITKQDVPNLISLGESFWNESEMKSLGEYNPQAIHRSLFNGLNHNLVGWVHEKQAKISKALICFISLNFWNEKKQLSELAWFSAKDSRGSLSSVKLIKTAEKFVRENEIDYFVMGRIKGPESYGKLGLFYQKLGFNELEQTFVKKYEKNNQKD